MRLHPPLDVVVIGFRIRDIQVRREDCLREFGRKLAAFVGCARLHLYRIALHRTWHIERTAHLVVFADMVEVVHALRFEIETGIDVAHEGIVIPAVPQALHNLNEFTGAAIAFLVVADARAAEIQGFGRLR